jgi:GTP pyrophosphokinase
MKRGLNVEQALDDWWANHRRNNADSAVLSPAIALARPLPSTIEGLPGVASPQHLVQLLQLLDLLKLDDLTLSATIYAHVLSLNASAAWSDAPPAVKKLSAALNEARVIRTRFASVESGADNESLRRLLLALISEVRVVLVVLAEQIVLMRAAKSAAPELRRALATQCKEIYAPLANRLGVSQLKWELEDLVFRYLEPDTYKHIATQLDGKREDRERYIAQVIAELSQVLKRAQIDGEVAGRPKHIFSIHKKMQRKGVGFEQIYDVRAFRILVRDVPSCYAALGLVHTLWTPIAGEFDDYIAVPKGNNYRSLHTAVIGPEGKALEVQIRTHEMHEHAELGVAAHWKYKEGGGADPGLDRTINQLRTLLSGAKGEDDLADAVEDVLSDDLSHERVYVLTPKGKIVDLPKGATVLDFAYQVHTEVGHRCRGAKVNGRIVPLTYKVFNGEQIEILTRENGEPSRDWLSAHTEYVYSRRSRAKIRQWFKRVDHSRNVEAGRDLLERELKRLHLHQLPLEPLLVRLKAQTIDELHLHIGTGEVTSQQVIRLLQESLKPKDREALEIIERPPAKPGRDAILIEGVGNLMHQMAACCKPVPGDPILGYITRGRGVSIHRFDCQALARLAAQDPSRVIEVDWGSAVDARYQATIDIRALDRKGLLRDVGQVFATERCSVRAVTTETDEAAGIAQMRFTVEVEDFNQLALLLARLSGLPNVLEARRRA